MPDSTLEFRQHHLFGILGSYEHRPEAVSIYIGQYTNFDITGKSREAFFRLVGTIKDLRIPHVIKGTDRFGFAFLEKQPTVSIKTDNSAVIINLIQALCFFEPSFGYIQKELSDNLKNIDFTQKPLMPHWLKTDGFGFSLAAGTSKENKITFIKMNEVCLMGIASRDCLEKFSIYKNESRAHIEYLDVKKVKSSFMNLYFTLFALPINILYAIGAYYKSPLFIYYNVIVLSLAAILAPILVTDIVQAPRLRQPLHEGLLRLSFLLETMLYTPTQGLINHYTNTLPSANISELPKQVDSLRHIFPDINEIQRELPGLLSLAEQDSFQNEILSESNDPLTFHR